MPFSAFNRIHWRTLALFASSLFIVEPFQLGTRLLAASSSPEEKNLAPGGVSSAELFEGTVAGILARNCLECHDSATREGKLDLSRRSNFFGNGPKQQIIVPGNAAASDLWKMVESNEMPDGKPPLSDADKNVLKQWIDSGAAWTTELLEPINYLREQQAPYNMIRRLTIPEYIETVRAATGVSIDKEANELLPPDVRADGFQNTAYNLGADLQHVEAYAKLAEIITSRMDPTAFAARFAPCRELNEECGKQWLEPMSKWLLRGPVTEEELKPYRALVAEVVNAKGTEKEAISLVVEAMLQSPRFLYRIEDQRGDGRPRQVKPYELASRMSYIVWGAPPDEELFKAAEAGVLQDETEVRTQVKRMMNDPRAKARSRQFALEWLDLGRLKSLRPDPAKHPEWLEELGKDMEEETLQLFEQVVWQEKKPLTRLLNMRETYVTPRLREFYQDGSQHDLRVTRFQKELAVLYRFEEGSGQVVRDLSYAGEPARLKMDGAAEKVWQPNGLKITPSAFVRTESTPKKLIQNIRESSNASFEIWFTPANITQKGPARIFTISSGPSERNVTVGQDGDKFEVRLRTSSTDGNGQPSLATPAGTARQELTHLVYTRDSGGKAKIYLNGKLTAEREVKGDLKKWDDNFQLVIGNESTRDRPWEGTIHLAAAYTRDLTGREIQELYDAGKKTIPTRKERSDIAVKTTVPNRVGILTHGSVLTVGGEDASMVARGLFLLQDFLYSTVGNPPPCANTTPVPSKPGLTQRAVAESRIKNPSCGGCHSKFEPLAFSLEKYDGLGSYHEKDEFGNKLREDGSIAFPGEAEAVSFQSTGELMDLLAASERVQKNFTRKLTQFALGRPLGSRDVAMIDKIHLEASEDGGTYQSLITAIVASELVRFTYTESNKDEENTTK